MSDIEKLEKKEANSNIIELQIRLIQENEKYNSTVCSIGYISMLAILSYTRKYISTRCMPVILLLFGISVFIFVISVFIFVIFEIIKTFRINIIAEKQFINYQKFLEGKITTAQLITENNNSWHNTWTWFSTKCQSILFMISALSGFVSGAILAIQIFCVFTQK